MESRHLGRTGLHVSAIGLGTMTWGRDTDDLDAAEQLRDFVEAGGTVLDTAASYSGGASEELLGSMLGPVVDRRDVVLCTKGGVRSTSTGNVVDASRGSLLDSLDASLARLGTDHVDVFWVQAPDAHAPLEETLQALALAVRSGRTRYVGLANHPGWQTGYAAALLREAQLELAGVQVEYSLLERGIEREVLPAARSLGAGVVAWSPLGRGVLTGKYRRSIPADSRGASAHLAGFVQPYLTSEATAVVEAVCTAAEGLGRSPLDVALSWVLGKVSTALVGARTPAQLRESLAASQNPLPPELVEALDEISAPAVGYPEQR